jgi:hypothetical protein
MANLDLRIVVDEVSIDGQQIPAFVLRHSRKKQVMAVVLALTFAVASVAMYFGAETAELPITGNNPTVTRVFAVFSFCFMCGLVVYSVWMLLQPLNYVAVTPSGILTSATRPPLFMAWGAIKKVRPHGSGNLRAVGIKIPYPEIIPALGPHVARMESVRKFSGWDWSIPVRAFDAPPHVVETALLYFFYCKEERPKVGTAQGLVKLQEALANEWQPPKKRRATTPEEEWEKSKEAFNPENLTEGERLMIQYMLTQRRTVKDHEQKFKHAPLGSWSQAVGTLAA